MARSTRAALSYVAGVAVLGACYGLAGALPASTAAEPKTVVETGNDAERVHYSANALPTLVGKGGEKRAVKSLLRVDRRMKYGEWQWNDRGIPAGKLWIRVDLEAQIMSIFRGGHEIGTAVVLYGTPKYPSPPGTYGILQRIRHHRSAKYNAPMPYTLRLTNDGIAIHASNVRLGAATHGCIGVPDAFAARLFEEARVGDEVTLV